MMGQNVSLLQCADNALFLGRWSLSSAENLICILICSQDMPRLRINIEKDRLYGIGIDPNEVESFSNTLNCKYDALLFVYLGIPIEVLGSLPLDCLSLFQAPIKLLHMNENILRRFFWGFKEESKGISWDKWESVLLGKHKGGLGIDSLTAKNLSLVGNGNEDFTWSVRLYGVKL
ncbi:hypothetical protein Tco_0999561 [Tanacetum coccineum]